MHKPQRMRPIIKYIERMHPASKYAERVRFACKCARGHVLKAIAPYKVSLKETTSERARPKRNCI